MTRIINATFVNNFGTSFVSSYQTNTVLKIFDSAFVRNKLTDGAGTLKIFAIVNVSIPRTAILMERVLFEENIATTGSALYIKLVQYFFATVRFSIILQFLQAVLLSAVMKVVLRAQLTSLYVIQYSDKPLKKPSSIQQNS